MMLSVAGAAAHLGISQNAIRNRLKRGSLKRFKRGNRIFVLVDDGQPDEGNERPSEGLAATNGAGQHPANGAANEDGNLANGLAAVLEAKNEQIADLKAQLEEAKQDKQAANGEKRELLEALKREQTLHQSAQRALEAPKASFWQRLIGKA